MRACRLWSSGLELISGSFNVDTCGFTLVMLLIPPCIMVQRTFNIQANKIIGKQLVMKPKCMGDTVSLITFICNKIIAYISNKDCSTLIGDP